MQTSEIEYINVTYDELMHSDSTPTRLLTLHGDIILQTIRICT